MKFQLKHYMLPYDGVIPGVAGHKKITVPAGTKVWCIVYGTKIFWCAYLTESSALKVLQSLQDTIDGKLRRKIDLDTLLAWNFRDIIPRRIHREKANG